MEDRVKPNARFSPRRVLVPHYNVEVNGQRNGLVVQRSGDEAKLAHRPGHTGIQIGIHWLNHLNTLGVSMFVNAYLQPNLGIGRSYGIECIGGDYQADGLQKLWGDYARAYAG
jgi:hypothetical protein